MWTNRERDIPIVQRNITQAVHTSIADVSMGIARGTRSKPKKAVTLIEGDAESGNLVRPLAALDAAPAFRLARNARLTLGHDLHLPRACVWATALMPPAPNPRRFPLSKESNLIQRANQTGPR